MSTFESVIWHVLGYSAIPFILLAGIFGASMVYFVITKLLGRENEK
jgi:uncharacterized protein (TIGR02808 family)